MLLCGDFNGHIGEKSAGYEGIHVSFGYSDCNPEGDRLLEFSMANYLAICNSFFKKKVNHLITYQSGGSSSQVDYILVKRSKFGLVTNIKVIPGEECVTHHKLLICDLSLKFTKPHKQSFTPRIRSWKLRDPEIKKSFSEAVKAQLSNSSNNITNVDERWQLLNDSLLKAAHEVCGITKKRTRRRETWWWNKTVNYAVSEKRCLWKAWNKGGSKEDNLSAKRTAKCAVYEAKERAEKDQLCNTDVFHVAKQMKRDQLDIMGKICMKDDEGN